MPHVSHYFIFKNATLQIQQISPSQMQDSSGEHERELVKVDEAVSVSVRLPDHLRHLFVRHDVTLEQKVITSQQYGHPASSSVMM